jgi:inosine-uridine nucleoside N-ribohydrolase
VYRIDPDGGPDAYMMTYMQNRGATLPPGFLFDSDMGRNIDAALALSMLYGLGRGRLIAVGISNSNLDAAAFVEAVARFYGGGVLPIGLAEDGSKIEDAPMLSVPLGMRNSDGQPAFRRTVREITDTADPAVVFRNGLLTQQDQQAIAVLAGPATNLARTLMLPGASAIVAAKVRLLVIAAGEFGGGRVDPRIRADVASARKLLAEWPTPIVAVGIEAAEVAPFPDSTIDTEFAGLPNHPVAPAYRAYRERQDNRPDGGVPVQGVLAALYAANPSADYFKLSPPGEIEVGEDGRTRFIESPRGRHRFLILDPAQKESITQAFIALITAKPTAGRGGPPRN